VPGQDTLIVRSNIINPKNHSLEVLTIIESFDQSVLDTIPMFDDGMHHDSSAGDGIWGVAWPIPSGERHYTLHTTTVSLDSGFKNILQNAAQFTTVGPIIFESHFNELLRLGVFSQRFLFKIRLQNKGQVATAEGIGATIKLLLPNSCFSMADSYREYADIAPGEIVDGTQFYSVNVDTNCLKGGFLYLPFSLEVESNGYVFWTDTFSIDIVSDIAYEESALSKKFTLGQNYPNPFNPTTYISFDLPKPEHVKIEIFSTLGQKVETLLNQRMKAGYHEVEFNAHSLSSGIYFYRIEAGEFQDVKKMILIR